MRFPEILEKIVSKPDLEIEFLELLSLLEYVGCRKILKGVPYNEITLEVLAHVQEESLHALAIKRLAGRGTWSDTLFAKSGWEYFSQLDLEISKCVEPSYPMVSYAIEQRVLQVYPLYIEKTKREDVKHALQAILGQERRHAMQFDAVKSDTWLKIEEKLWMEFEMKMGEVVNNDGNDCSANSQSGEGKKG